jgi:hypothetical protein
MKKLQLKPTDVYGELTVVGEDPEKRSDGIHWICQCSCGTQISVAGSRLVRDGHKTRSCGHLRFEPHLSVRIRPYECLYNILKGYAQKRFGVVELAYEQFLEFTKITKCHYCNAAVSWTKFNVTKHGNAYNLDRVDASKNYKPNNLVVCCARCNRGKSDCFTYDEWYGMTSYFRKSESGVL